MRLLVLPHLERGLTRPLGLVVLEQVQLTCTDVEIALLPVRAGSSRPHVSPWTFPPSLGLL